MYTRFVSHCAVFWATELLEVPMGTSSRPLLGSASESPLAHLDDETLIRRYCAALATASTDEEAVGELWHHRHGPILLQKIKYIAAKPGEIRPDFIDFKPFVEASHSWAWQKYLGGIRRLQNPGSNKAILAWLEEVAYTSCMTEQRVILTRGRIRPVPLDEVVGQEDVPAGEYETDKERGAKYKLRPDLADRQPSAPVHCRQRAQVHRSRAPRLPRPIVRKSQRERPLCAPVPLERLEVSANCPALLCRPGRRDAEKSG
jgi:hypothetical protein